ncbi:unnamed protein product [Diatraea saccharalis]|uniref:Uncharacterized protein n=1 Tax=Diatraea saccharalis TaxID=40085 RepID=A0A9P0C4X7_9NEOP|nr:unnamed protein product [Diatraea saccharalis]
MKPENHECRACLQAIDSVSLLFEPWSPDWDGMENTIAEDLAKIANIQVSESDRHSKFICHLCVNQLKQACQFILLVQRNDRILRLRNTQGNDEVWPKPIQVDKNIACDNFLQVDIKQEVLSDDEQSYNNEEYTETEYINQQLDIKVEPEEIVQPSLQININGVSSLQEVENEKVTTHNGEVHYDEEFLNAKVKEEPMSETEDTESMPSDLPLECLLCTRSFSSISGLKAHVIAQHSYKSVKRKVSGSSPQELPKMKYMCAICKRIFTTSTDLMVHETCHNKDVCYVCNAKFDSFDKLSEHRKRCKALSSKETTKPKTLDDVIRHSAEEDLTTAPSKDVLKNELPKEAVIKDEPSNENVLKSNDSTETLFCEMCNEQFSDSYYMKIHQEIHHNKETVETDIKAPVPMLEMDTLENIFKEDT